MPPVEPYVPQNHPTTVPEDTAHQSDTKPELLDIEVFASTPTTADDLVMATGVTDGFLPAQPPPPTTPLIFNTYPQPDPSIQPRSGPVFGPTLDSPAPLLNPAAVQEPFQLWGNQLATASPPALAFAGDPPVEVRGTEALEVLSDFLDPEVQYTEADLRDIANADTTPEVVVSAADYLLDNPVMLSNVFLASTPIVAGAEPGVSNAWIFGDEIESDVLTVAELNDAVIQNEGAAVLADPNTFRLIAGDNDRITAGDIQTAIDDGVLPEEDAAALQALISTPLSHPDYGENFTQFNRVESTRRQTVDEDLPDVDGDLSWEDALGFSINQHAFADDPAAARELVLSLPATFEDISGKSGGIDIRLSSGEGVRALAEAALSDAESLEEQVIIVSRLPESRDGQRNLMITAFYSELGLRMNDRLNGHLENPLDPSSDGHSGANWMMMAPWASNSLRPALIGDQTVFGFSPTWSDRQYLADGNQYIFGDVAPRYAAFLDAFPAGEPVTEADINNFFNEQRLSDGRPMFEPGHQQLRDSFVYYLAAAETDSPKYRQELTFAGNGLIATHEQAGVQNYLEGVVDLGVGDDGLFRGIVGETFAAFVGGDELVATGAMQLRVGTGDDSTVFIPNRDLRNDEFDITNNLLIGVDQTDRLNPANYSWVHVGDIDVSLRGGERDVNLPVLGGWGAPPDGSNMDALSVSTLDWYEQGTNNSFVAGGQVIAEDAGSRDGTDLQGTGALDWGDWQDRQWYILNLFHQTHTDPVVFDTQSGLGLSWLQAQSGDNWVPDNVDAEFRN